MIAPSLIAAGGSLGASALAFWSAERQMNFQRDLSGSAHQREVEDLRRAGLNPLLSAGGSGASTPSGASVHPENPARSAVELYLQHRLQRAQIKLMEDQGEAARGSEMQALTQAGLNQKLAAKIDAEMPYISNMATAQQVQMALNRSNITLNERQLEAIDAIISLHYAQRNQTTAQTRITNADAVYRELEAAFYGTPAGKLQMVGKKIFDVLSPLGIFTGGTALGLERLFKMIPGKRLPNIKNLER